VGASDLAGRLCGSDIEEALFYLHRATKSCLEGSADTNEVRAGARSALGWLLLLSVREEWIRTQRGSTPEKDTDLELRIPVETEAATEVLVARLNEFPATFQTDAAGMRVFGQCHATTGMRVFGQCHATTGMRIAEVGWDAKDPVLEVKKAIWKALFKSDVEAWTPARDKELNATLKVRRRLGEHHYLTVHTHVSGDPLDEPSVYSALRKDLPDLQACFLSGPGDQQVLLLGEVNLMVHIREFLRTTR
jgi:hypothetical protein